MKRPWDHQYLAAFAERVVRRRHTLNLSQREVSRRAGLTNSTLANLEERRCAPVLNTAARIARALDTTLAELCGETDA